MTGINIYIEYLTEEMITKVQNEDSLIGIWYSARRSEETEEMW